MKKNVVSGLEASIIKLGVLFLVLCLITLTTLVIYSLVNPSATAESKKHNYSNPHTTLRPFIDYKFKPVCSSPQPGQPQCLADFAVNSNNQELNDPSPEDLDGYGPQQFHTAYNLPCAPGGPVQSICSTPTTFGPQTIAIVDLGSYDGAGTIESNLATFDSYYGLPACTVANGCLSILNDEGQTSPLPPAASSDPSGWAVEMDLDVETAHMICQTCEITLYESGYLWVGDNTAATSGAVSVSDSWLYEGDQTSEDSDVDHSGVAVVAATGDGGSNELYGTWPADNPDVVAASGTTLNINEDSSWASETVWDGSGGGCNPYYTAPSWQLSLSNWATVGCGSYRGIGDISSDADPDTGLNMYDGSGWGVVGGTSLAAPTIAASFALAGGVAPGVMAPSVIYQNFNSANSHNITSGNDCTSEGEAHCTAGVGYNTPSGMGTLNGIEGLEADPLSAPTNLTATDIDQADIKLSWTASSSTFPVNQYTIYRDGSEVGTTTSTTYTDSGLTPDTTYTYNVTASDNTTSTPEAANDASTTTYYPEDITHAGHVGLLDLSILAEEYGEVGPDLSADFTHQGTVNLVDLSLLAQYYNE